MPLTFHPPLNPEAQSELGDIFQPGFGETFKASALESIKMTTPVMVYDQIRFGMARREGEVLAQADYEASDSFRPGIKWHPGMTDDEAEILAARHDKTTKNQFIVSRGGFLPVVVGSLIGSVPDPVNFVPVFGMATRARAATRFGKALGFGLVNSAEAAIMTAGLQPIFAANAETFQEDHDWRNMVEQVAMAGVIGFGFGAITSPLMRVPDGARVRSTSKALKDIISGRPVDISDAAPPRTVIPDEIQVEMRDYLNNPERQDVIVSLNEDGTGLTDLSPQERARAVINALEKPEPQRTMLENQMLETTDITPEVRRAVEIGKQETRSKDDKAFLRAYLGNKMTDYYKTKVEASTAQIESLRERFKKETGRELGDDELAQTLGGEHPAAKVVAEGEKHGTARGIEVSKTRTTNKVKEVPVEMENGTVTNFDSNMPQYVLESRVGGKWDIVEIGPGDGTGAARPRTVIGEGMPLKDAKRIAVDLLQEYDAANPATLRLSDKAEQLLSDIARSRAELGVLLGRLGEAEGGKPLHYGVADEPDLDLPEHVPTTEETINTKLTVEEMQEHISVMDEHIAAMEREGILPEDVKAELETLQAEKAEIDKWADSYDDAARCVLENI